MAEKRGVGKGDLSGNSCGNVTWADLSSVQCTRT